MDRALCLGAYDLGELLPALVQKERVAQHAGRVHHSSYRSVVGTDGLEQLAQALLVGHVRAPEGDIAARRPDPLDPPLGLGPGSVLPISTSRAATRLAMCSAVVRPRWPAPPVIR